jgi:hypothetical protein
MACKIIRNGLLAAKKHAYTMITLDSGLKIRSGCSDEVEMVLEVRRHLPHRRRQTIDEVTMTEVLFGDDHFSNSTSIIFQTFNAGYTMRDKH